MKYCKDCKYLEAGNVHFWCAYPECTVISLVTSKVTSVRLCKEARSTDALCGEDAKWFDPKPSRLQLFLQFFQPAPKV